MGKTITTHLIDGSPKGLKSIEISNRSIMAFVIPRADLEQCKQLEELHTHSLYFLFGESMDSKPKAYVGETDSFIDRVYEHNKNKEFWDTAIVFISQSGSINKADILYLEYLSIMLAQKTDKYNLEENKRIPKKPNLKRHEKDTVEDFFIDVKFLTEFTGFNLFKSFQPKENKKNIFYNKNRGANAIVLYDENGFTVLKGSMVSKDVVKSFTWKEKRNNILKDIAIEKDGELILQTDKTFSSPSTAADFCIGSSNNGWIVWKNKEGKTLDEIFRK